MQVAMQPQPSLQLYAHAKHSASSSPAALTSLFAIPDAVEARWRIHTPPIPADIADAVCADLAGACHTALPVAHLAAVYVSFVIIPQPVGAVRSLPAHTT